MPRTTGGDEFVLLGTSSLGVWDEGYTWEGEEEEDEDDSACCSYLNLCLICSIFF